jgi:hypothetical protein
LFGAVLLAFGLLAGVAPAADLPTQAARPPTPGPVVAQQAALQSADVAVANTITADATKTYLWRIAKTATPDQLDLFDGATGVVKYEIVVRNTGETNTYEIIGDIAITNNGTEAVTVSAVAVDVVGVGSVAVTCERALPIEIPVGLVLGCDYTTSAPDATTRRNTVTVTLGDASTVETVDGAVFGTPDEVNKTITVSDTNHTGRLGTATVAESPKTFSYSETESCRGAVWTNLTGTRTATNTATIVETATSATETVDIDCYKLGVSKTATESIGDRHVWTIDKTSTVTSLDLDKGERKDVSFTITVSNTRRTIDGWFVDGDIVITNPAPMAAVVDVTDVLSRSGVADVAATVNCDGDGLDVSIPAKGTKTCTYHASLPNGDARTNTATVTLDGIGTRFTGTAAVDFTGVTSQDLDDYVNIYDDNGTPGTTSDDVYLGRFAAGTSRSFTHVARLYYGDRCGDYIYVNTVRLIGEDTGITVRDSHRINVDIDCDQQPTPTPDDDRGCTYGHGYWKNHLDEPAWDTLESATFFKSGQTYAQAIGTNSKGGNAYYILARQYITTALNKLNGATPPAGVQSAFDQATRLFNNYTPAQIGDMKGNDSIRKQFIHLAGDLGNYPGGACGSG